MTNVANQKPGDAVRAAEGATGGVVPGGCHLGCAVGALLIPDKNIAVCRTSFDTPPRAGAEILIFNGSDGEWRAGIAQTGKKRCTLDLDSLRPQGRVSIIL